MATSMTWASFTAIPDGTKVFNHGYSECVALANLYHESVIGGSFVPVNSAYQWWTQFGSYATLRNNYAQAGHPVAGAVVVSKGGPYNNIDGHIGVVTRVHGNGTFDTMEQNAAHRYVWRYNRNMWGVLGFLIPHNNPANQEEDDMFSDADRALLKQTAQKANATYDAIFKRTPTSQGYHSGLLPMTNAIYDAQFKETETSRGTPGGTLVNDRIILEQLAKITERLDALDKGDNQK